MAQNELEDGASINLVLSRRFGVQGAPAPFMASEVFPTLAMEGPSAPPEYHFLGGSRLVAGQRLDTAAAANFSHAGLQNPLESGALIVVHRIILNESAGVNDTLIVAIGGQAAAFVGAVGGEFRDTRQGFGANTGSAGKIFISTQATQLGREMFRVRMETQSTLAIDQPGIVLGPGGFCVCRPNGQNSQVDASFLWVERALTKGELIDAQPVS